MSARGIIGNKPIPRSDTATSDVYNLRTQFESSLTGAVSLPYGRSGGFVLFRDIAGDRPFVYYSKESNGKYYPRSSINYVPVVAGGTASTGTHSTASYGAAWIATLWVPGPSYIKIFKKSSAGLADFEYVTDIHILTNNNGDADVRKITFSNDGTYLIVGAYELIGSTGYKSLRMYKRTGNSFSELSIVQPVTSVSTYYQIIGQAAWNNDSSSFAIYYYGNFNGTVAGSLGIAVYNRSGDTFTKVFSASTGTKIVANLVWSNSGTSLYVIYSGTSGWDVYNRSGDTFTAITGLPTPPDYGVTSGGNRHNSASINSTDNLIAMPRYANADATISKTAVYSRSGDTFTLVSYFSISGAGGSSQSTAALFLNDSELLVNTATRPFILDVNGTTLSHPYSPKLGDVTEWRMYTGTATYLGNGVDPGATPRGSSTAAFWQTTATAVVAV